MSECKATVFWGQVDGLRVIEFEDGYAELQKWEDGEIKILEVDKVHEIISKHISWLTSAPETGMKSYRMIVDKEKVT